MKTIKTEVLVVGSGFGAAAPALRLSEAGFNVLMIEKGMNIVPERDFKQTADPKYFLNYLKGISNESVSFTYAEALGGGSGFYEMVSLRAPSKVFHQIDKNGNQLWPDGIDRNAFDPYYELAEKMINVEQIGADEIPKSGVAFSLLMKNLGYSCDRSRYAVRGCVGSGYCVSGCIFGAKESLHLNYLPQAKAAGMEILTDTEAVSVHSLHNTLKESPNEKLINKIQHRYKVLCRNAKTKEEFVIHSKILILGGGTIGTAKLLLNSHKHLPLLGRHVGKNIAFNGSIKAAGLLPDGFIEGDMLTGRSHPGMISYHFFDSLGITISSIKPLPLHLLTAARLYCEDDSNKLTFWGEANVNLMKRYRKRMIVLYTLGLTSPGAEIFQNNDGSFQTVLNLDQELKNYHEQTQDLLHSIFRRNNCKIINTHLINHEGSEYKNIHFDTSHMVGSCRMANRKEYGVINSNGEVFEYPGLYISDGASIPSSLAVNPSLTILANAERIAAHLLSSYSKDQHIIHT